MSVGLEAEMSWQMLAGLETDYPRRTANHLSVERGVGQLSQPYPTSRLCSSNPVAVLVEGLTITPRFHQRRNIC